MFEPEDTWHDFEAMIEEFSDSEMPSESAATEAVFAHRKDNDSDSELYLSDSAMSEDSQLNLNLIFCQLYRLPPLLFFTVASPSPVAVQHIEDMVLSFLTQLAMPGRLKENKESTENSDLENMHISKAKHKIEIRLADRRKTDDQGVPALKCIRYPKKSKHGSAKPLAQLFKVLDLAHGATLNDLPATKRDIFYQDVPLFKTQKVVDTLVDDLAATFELGRSDLNIRSSSKGLICGSGLTITLKSGESLIGHDTEGTLIPSGEDIESFSVDEDVAWILIVEKDAVFQTLCHLKLTKHELMPGSGIVITGKGYPDVATRHIVKSLADALPRSIPFLGIVDADPYGLDILSVYKYGSKGMQHENVKLAAPRIKWLGLWASELESFGIGEDGLLPITKHDEKKALTMLQRNTRLPSRWKKELQYILHSRRKAEIEILASKKYEGKSREPFSEISCATNPDFVQDNIDTSRRRDGPALLDDLTSPRTSFKHGAHVFLVRYLGLKVTDYVLSARRCDVD